MITKQAAQQAYQIGVQQALAAAGLIKTAFNWGEMGSRLLGQAKASPIASSALAGGSLGAIGGLATRDEGGPFGIGAESRLGAMLRGAGIGAALGAGGGAVWKHGIKPQLDAARVLKTPRYGDFMTEEAQASGLHRLAGKEPRVNVNPAFPEPDYRDLMGEAARNYNPEIGPMQWY